jgi:hypothetical protein
VRALLPLPLLLAACDPFADGGATDETDVGGDQVATVDQCTETYSIPGPFGVILDNAVDPHQDVFGTEEALDGDPNNGMEGPDPRHVHLGWPGADTSTSISFVWETDTGTLASVVEIAEGDTVGDDATRYEGVSFRYGGTDAQSYRVHELKLCGRLKPSTTYTYRVGGEGHWSKAFTFSTPPAPGTFDTFTAVFTGDSRGSYEDWATLVQRALAEDPDVMFFSGDAVDVGGDQKEWYAWWEASQDAFAEHVLVPSHGNHEFLATNYFALFSLPNNEQWFTVDFGSITLASLNDTVNDPASKQFAQVDFMNDRFGKSTATWKLAMHHSPTYSICSRHGSDEELRGFWEPVFEAQGVDMVFAGHNHIYERSIPIRDGTEVPAGQGTIYVVTGGAGADLYPELESAQELTWFNEVANPVHHYMVGEFSSAGVQFTVKDLDGNQIDSFFVPKD